jgi:hypothetical protein
MEALKATTFKEVEESLSIMLVFIKHRPTVSSYPGSLNIPVTQPMNSDTGFLRLSSTISRVQTKVTSPLNFKTLSSQWGSAPILSMQEGGRSQAMES